MHESDGFMYPVILFEKIFGLPFLGSFAKFFFECPKEGEIAVKSRGSCDGIKGFIGRVEEKKTRFQKPFAFYVLLDGTACGFFEAVHEVASAYKYFCGKRVNG
jgi:hypothetical protein